MTHHVDQRTRRQIDRMPDYVLEEYRVTIGTELKRARAKRKRLTRDLQCTKAAELRSPKERRLSRLDRQIEILEQIINYVDQVARP